MLAPVVLTLLQVLSVTRCGHDIKSLPSNDEITKVALQAERAVRLYTPVVAEQAARLGGEEVVADDRKTITDISAVSEGIQQTPQRFNGPDGFAFIEMVRALEDSGDSCASAAATAALNQQSPEQKTQAVALVQLSVSCTKSAALFRAVGDNSAVLFSRFLRAQEK
jgi:hypothetical protein